MRRLLPPLLALLLVGPARAEIAFLGAGSVPGDAADKSGLKDALPDGTPHDRLGGIGSAIAWTGSGNRYVLLPDSGPKGGAVPYACRYHVVTVTARPGQTPPVTVELEETHL